MQADAPSPKFKIIRYIYIYLVTAICIVITLISAIGFVKIVLDEYVFGVKEYDAFDKAYECQDDTLFYIYDTKGIKQEKYPNISATDKETKRAVCEKEQKDIKQLRHINNIKMNLSSNLAMLLIAFPLYLYHWGVIKKENKK
ncbi:MAG: hypothetical protein WC806_05170 [Candidatus Gracilibacteria bacterium]|jgi:hypothetical protein